MRVGPSFREGPGPTRDQRHATHNGGVCFPYGTPYRRGAGAEAAATLRHIAGALPARHVGERPTAVLRETSMEEKLDRLFHLKEHGTTVKTEVLAGLTTGVLFLLSMFLSPFFLAIPSFATAPALVIVGSLMASSVLSIDFGDPTESIPAFLCFVGMPFCYSIVEGISLGIISYVVINLLAGNAKKISPMMYVLAVVFIVKYILI